MYNLPVHLSVRYSYNSNIKAHYLAVHRCKDLQHNCPAICVYSLTPRSSPQLLLSYDQYSAGERNMHSTVQLTQQLFGTFKFHYMTTAMLFVAGYIFTMCCRELYAVKSRM